MSRRAVQTAALLIVTLCALPITAYAQKESDTRQQELFTRIMERRTAAMEETLADVAALFIGTPYAAHTLETYPAPERLTVRLDSVDCTTFVEQALALWIIGREGTWDEFTRQLTRIRYGSDSIKGYASRLHYITAWAEANTAAGRTVNPMDSLCPGRLTPQCNFMTRHREKYPAIANDSTEYARIAAMEERLAGTSLCILPKEDFNRYSGMIHHGDIIAFLTTTEGLDVSHIGIAYEKEGKTALLHAPTVGKEVEISHESIGEILGNRLTYSGLIVLRPLK